MSVWSQQHTSENCPHVNQPLAPKNAQNRILISAAKWIWKLKNKILTITRKWKRRIVPANATWYWTATCVITRLHWERHDMHCMWHEGRVWTRLEWVRCSCSYKTSSSWTSLTIMANIQYKKCKRFVFVFMTSSISWSTFCLAVNYESMGERREREQARGAAFDTRPNQKSPLEIFLRHFLIG